MGLQARMLYVIILDVVNHSTVSYPGIERGIV